MLPSGGLFPGTELIPLVSLPQRRLEKRGGGGGGGGNISMKPASWTLATDMQDPLGSRFNITIALIFESLVNDPAYQAVVILAIIHWVRSINAITLQIL